MVGGRTSVIFGLAIALGIGAMWFANSWIRSRLTPTEEVGALPVVVAAVEIPFGQKIEAAHVKTVNWPSQYVPPNVYQNVAEVTAKVANQKIFADEPLMKGRIVDQVEGSTLSAMISLNKRAITVRVNDVIGVAGFLLPGNRVDVIASRKTDRRAHTEIILQDVKVLAVDQTASPEKDKPIVVRAVTLELDPKQTEKLVKATEEGSVQLALRNPRDESRVAKSESAPAPSAPAAAHTDSINREKPAFVSSFTVIRGTRVNVSKRTL